MFLLPFIILLWSCLIFGPYLIFNSLYNKKNKRIFKWLAFLPKLYLLAVTFALIPLFIFVIHYKKLDNYEELKIESYKDIENLTHIESIYYYEDIFNDNKNYVIIINTKYKKYTGKVYQPILELLDTAGELNDKLVPHEISNITTLLITISVGLFIGATFIAIFVNDKKNVLVLIAIGALILISIISIVC